MTRTLFVWVALSGLVLLATGCGDKTDQSGTPAETQDQKQWKVVQTVIDGNREMAELLKGIKDVETATAAAPKLQAAIDRLKAAGKQMETFAEPTEAMKERMAKEFDPAMAEAQGVTQTEAERLGAMPEVMAIIGPVLASMDEE